MGAAHKNRHHGVLVCLGAVGCLASAMAAAQDDRPLVAADPPYERLQPDRLRCGTDRLRARLSGLLARGPVEDGQPVSFHQDPPILSPDYAGTIRFRDFTVVGDHEAVRFKLNDPEAPADRTETWRRIGTRTIEGLTVSVFEPCWPDAALARMLRDSHGFDAPLLDWGEFLPPGTDVGRGRTFDVRLATTNLPSVRAVRINDAVQFTSHVVNLVLPNFGDARVSRDEQDLDAASVGRMFYEHFDDSYDSLAVIPQAVHPAESLAFHQNVKNDIRGIGELVFDNSSRYGSSGRLKSFEIYHQASFAVNRNSSHEIAHQWGSYFDWTTLAGITTAGHQPSSHDPLWAEGETYLGAILRSTRRVRRVTDGGWEIERTPAPIRHHPMLLYAMGILSRDQVPEVAIFEEQAQFAPDRTSAPDPGTKVRGAFRTVTAHNVVGRHGERIGPTPTEWHRATIVVSRGGLLSQRELDYWTFFAQRLEDSGRTGVMSYDGHPSFDLSTRSAVDLKTDVRPKAGGKIDQRLPVDFPDFGRSDWRGVAFESTVPSRFKVGERVRLFGRVTATDRRDFNQVLMRFWKYAGTRDDGVLFWADVSSSGSFIADIEFREHQRGRYAVEVFLFWPGAEAQYPRSSLTPAFVE